MTQLQKKIIKENSNLSQMELLNWSMNQLFRAAREIDLLMIGKGSDRNLISMSCEITATVILKNLIKDKKAYELIQKTNPKLLRGYKSPLKNKRKHKS